MRAALPTGFVILAFLGACSGGDPARDGRVYAPGIDPGAQAQDGLTVGHRLMAAGEHQLALEAFTRAAGQQGLTPEVLLSLGSANLALGRLNQSEGLLRRAAEADPERPAAWNNLGVVLIERGKTAEAAGVFRRAFALDNGQSAAIRDNLRLALAKLENPGYADTAQEQYRLVREGSGSYGIRRVP